MSKLKVFFIPTNVSGVVFYRAWQPYLSLKGKAGVEPMIWWFKPNQYMLHPWESQIRDPEMGPTIVRDLDCGCEWADIVVWMGLHSYEALNLFKYLKRKHQKKFIMEIDDYLLSIPAKNAAHNYYKPGSELTKVGLEQMKISDGVICSTPYLKWLYDDFNDNIKVAENVIDFTLWRKSRPPVRQGVTIGWVGGGTHEDDLAVIKAPMFRILEKYKNVTFKILHGIPDFFKNHKQIKWSKDFKPVDKYPKWVVKQKFDIGVAPLVDNNFNRGKSNLRWLEYSAMGIPTVASPLPHFTSAIQHGVTGFIANTEEQWEHYLTQLIEDERLRLTVGQQARDEVKENWSLKSLGKKYKTVIKEFYNAEPDTSISSVPGQRLPQRPERQPLDGGAEAGQNSGSAGTICGGQPGPN